VLLIVSLIAVYALQPLLPIRYLGFILPGATLVLTIVCWWLTRPPDAPIARDDRLALVLVAAVVIGLALTRDIRPEFRPVATRPPNPLAVAVVVAILAAAGIGLWRLVAVSRWRGAPTAMIALIVVVFVALKSEPLAEALAAWLRLQTVQQPELASVADMQWLGFSYVAFRLIHTLRDRQTGRLPALSLPEYTTYALFFPALTAGPIDRAERFVTDYRALASLSGLAAPRYVVGTTRIVVGLFKKFVIADFLALIALNPVNAAQTTSASALWLLVYAYAFRLYFDFSGYTDIAIGIGILYGIRLPENFDRPYLRQSLAAFWQSWHITLGNWARFYVFSPLSRSLLGRKPRPSPLLVVLVAQVATMLTIGLWHCIALTFVIWGLWHGLGLFAHKVWSDRTRAWFMALQTRPGQRRAWTVAGVLITFHFVALSWVWFAVPDFNLAARVLLRLFGLGW
jgi:D-alanyl-lipoteichoic acid acyltransferase DltB (MBOAT superfamily)